MKIVWVCEKCNWVSVSDSKYRHQMDTCQCGESSVDLEEGYSRFTGNNIRYLNIYDKGKWRAVRKQRKKNNG